jgi:5'-3' exonuclease
MWALIDGNNWFHADYRADENNCVKYFVNRVMDVTAKYRFARTVVAFDSHPSWRTDVYPLYKAGRDPKPDLFLQLFAELRSKLAEKGIEVVEQPRMEADDLVADLARRARMADIKAVIFSSDRDFHQCLREGCVTQVKKVSRVDHQIACEFVTARDLYAKYSVVPSQWVDYRCITGDSIDNIPGCVGLGPDAAAKVLSVFPSLDEFAADPDGVELGPKTREKLIEFCGSEDLRIFRKIMSLAPIVAPVGASVVEPVVASC